MSRILGKKLYQQGQVDDAIRQFLKEDADPAEDGELSYLLGLCYTKLQDFDQAIAYLLRVLEIDFHILRGFQSRMVLAYIYNVTEDYAQARHHLRMMLEEGFESPQIHSSLGYAYWCMGQYDEAVEHYEKALELDENHATTLNSLGYILTEQGDRMNDALEYCQKALSLDPLNPNYLDSMGWACFKTGRYEDAVTYLSKACQNEDCDEMIYDHLNRVKQLL